MTYKQAVSEARQLTKRSEKDQWRLAEITSEQVKAGKSRRQWAKDIGLSEGYVRHLYAIWERWSAYSVRTRPPFAEAYNSVHPGNTYEATLERGARQATPGQIAEIVKRDPEIMRRAVKSDPELATIAREAHLKNELARRPSDIRGDQVIKQMVDEAKRDNAALAYMDARKYVTELMDFGARDVAEQLARQARSTSNIVGYQRECDEMAQYMNRLAGALGSMARGGALEVVKNA